MFNPENGKIFEQFSRKILWEFTHNVRFFIKLLWKGGTAGGSSISRDTNLKILATKVPPCLRTCVVMFKAASSNWAWIEK